MEPTRNSQERNEFFQKLKPCCVKLSQLAIREPEGAAVARQINEVTDQLLTILNEQISHNPMALDEKLAEYVFFPLYHVFRQIERLPAFLMENCIKCLTILIIHGWKSKISPKLVQQILTLLTFIIDGNPGSSEKHIMDEETMLEAFRGLTALFNTASQSLAAAAGLSDTDAIPSLGHGISVILDGAVDGKTPQIQQEALRALQAVYLTITEHAALASFLPGTISSLAKLLSTPAKFKMTVIAKAVDTVSLTLTRVLSDIKTRSILANSESNKEEKRVEDGNPLSLAWLKATTIQVKKALSTMMKLRLQHSEEVRNSLRKLCITLLDQCHKTLENCAPFLIETAMILDEGGDKLSFTETSLQHLVGIYPELGETAKTTTYNWMSSLSRTMQTGDEDSKQQAIHNVLKGLELLKALQIESPTLEDSVSNALMDTVVSLIRDTKAGQSDEGTNIRLLAGGDTQSEPEDLHYPPVLFTHESQKRIRNEIKSLVEFLGSSQDVRFAGNMLEQVQNSASWDQVASFWLCFQLCKAGHSSSTEDEMFLDLSSLADSSGDLDSIFNELYSTSVQIIDRHSGVASVDWRMEAIALEVTAYTARRSGESFRPELIDVLFPIATFLGSSNRNLQKHAIVTLNSLAASCGYDNVSDLIIENVDYMVNSVSLKLNTLDISPASINVLTMMIRLSGPRLVPYLDDVIESVFAALENYHGYPMFVESLFVVLKEVVEQGVQSDILLLEHQKTREIDHRKKPTEADGISSLIKILSKREEKRKELETLDNEEKVGHPKAPWKIEKEQDQDDDSADHIQEEEKPPNTTTYQLLLRVANLTQHYLTSPTPTLRRSLLELLTTASDALAVDEDAFLPLVNAIWPVVVDRLHDSEAFIVIEACHTLSALCAAAGDFLGSRFKTEWGDWLRDWCRKVKRQASGTPGRSKAPGEQGKIMGIGVEKTQILMPFGGKNGSEGSTMTKEVVSYSGGGLGQFASPARIWEAAIELLTAMVSYVRVDDNMFDDVLDLLQEALDSNKKAREALEAINGDAVWLSLYERGAIEWIPAPKVDGVEFVTMEKPS